MNTKMWLSSILFFSSWLFASHSFSQDDASNQKLSQPVYQVKSQFNVSVPMRDGIILSADIYRPDAEGKFPVLLTRTYYGKCQHDIFHDNDNLSACSSKEFIEYFFPSILVD